jgi:hypothetical protein
VSEAEDTRVQDRYRQAHREAGRLAGRPTGMHVDRHIDQPIYHETLLTKSSTNQLIAGVGFVKPHMPHVFPKRFLDVVPALEETTLATNM